jgi:hypothetical protein
MKCRYPALNAQGSRLIIVPVQLGAVKLYVATVEALRKKESQCGMKGSYKVIHHQDDNLMIKRPGTKFGKTTMRC